MRRLVTAAFAAVVLCACQSAGGVGRTAESAAVTGANAVGMTAAGACRVAGKSNLDLLDLQLQEATDEPGVLDVHGKFKARAAVIDGACDDFIVLWERVEAIHEQAKSLADVGAVVLAEGPQLKAKAEDVLVQLRALAAETGLNIPELSQ